MDSLGNGVGHDIPLPCPFCGCEKMTVAEGSTFRWAVGECNSCSATCGEVRVDTFHVRNEDVIRANVITEWNKRHKTEVFELMQDAYGAGQTEEREACAEICEEAGTSMAWGCAPIIRARSVALVIAEEREACGWQDIETAPKDGMHILVLIPGSDIEKVVSWCDEPKNNNPKDSKGLGWRMSWDSYLFNGRNQPTFWMPLPAAPKDEVTE